MWFQHPAVRNWTQLLLLGSPKFPKSMFAPLQGKASGTYVHFDPAQDGMDGQTLIIRGPMLKVYRAHALLMRRYHETQHEAACLKHKNRDTFSHKESCWMRVASWCWIKQRRFDLIQTAATSQGGRWTRPSPELWTEPSRPASGAGQQATVRAQTFGKLHF